ncbi:MAG TPA: GlcNAc-transferase family protein [Actinoplanes sp.]|nr:GlcNAc-transferase family protein [Actinoplanes sp.]
MSIFVAIPAYRDSELVPTVLDALATAADPAGVTFGICWQRSGSDSIEPLLALPQVRVVEFDYREARGLGWARAQAATLYDGSDYVLQLDSHHRFVPGWDRILVEQLALAPSDKPLLSTWGPHYVPGRECGSADPVRIVFGAFDADGNPWFNQTPITDWRSRTAPVPGGFVCGHMIFARASFLAEVPSDPRIYFFGEETSTAVRAFTWGWDIFAPSRHVLWHLWGGAGTRTKHWEDHADPAQDRPWWRIEARSRRRVQALLANPGLEMGCGPVRTLAEYQSYVGVDFVGRTATRTAVAGDELPLYRSLVTP